MTKVQLKKHCKYLETKLLAEWSLRVRATGACAICGATEHLNAHHILCKERYKTLRYDLSNGICLCPVHHKYGALSAHRNAIWFANWLQCAMPELHNHAICCMHNYNAPALTIDELEAKCMEWGVKFKRPINKKLKK